MLPLNMRGNYVEDNGRAVTDLDRFTMSHVPPKSPYLWVHTASCIFKTLVTLALLDRFSAWVMAQQLRARRSTPTSWASQRTVLVTHIPHGADVEATFKEWYGEHAVERITWIVHTQVLAPLVAEKAALTAALETVRAQLAMSEPDQPRPTRRVPACSPCAERVDAIDFSTELLLECESRLAAARRAVLAHPPTTARLLRRAAFVTFKSARTASVASQCVHACDSSTWQVTAAVEPGNVLWENVGRYTSSQALALRIVSWVVTVSFCALYLVPAAAIQSLTFASELANFLPGAKGFLTNPARQSLVEGVLPSVLLFLLAWLWPLFLRMFTVWQGATTWADVDKGMTAKGLLFNVLVGFISTVLSGAVASGLREFVDNPAHIPQLLAVKVPATSRFFMNYAILQGVGASFASVARWWQAIQYAGRFTGAGKGDAKWPPFHQPFGRLYPHILLQLQILVLFSTLAPIMHAVSLLGFFIPAISCAKVKMFYHHEKAYEGYGRMWPLVRQCVVLILILYQLTMAGLLGLKGGVFPAWVLGVATIPLTVLYGHRMAVRYNPSMLGAVPVEVYAERDRKTKEHRRQSATTDDGEHNGHGGGRSGLTATHTEHHVDVHADDAQHRVTHHHMDLLTLDDLQTHPVHPQIASSSTTRLQHLSGTISRSASQPVVSAAAIAAESIHAPTAVRRSSLPASEAVHAANSRQLVGIDETAATSSPAATAHDANTRAHGSGHHNLERPYLPYLWPPLADVDASLAADSALTHRFGRVTLDDVVAATVAMAGAGAGLLERGASTALRLAPGPLKPFIKGTMRFLFDKVDFHSGVDVMEDDETTEEGPSAGGSPQGPASMAQMRSLTALRVASGNDAGGQVTRTGRTSPVDILGRL